MSHNHSHIWDIGKDTLSSETGLSIWSECCRALDKRGVQHDRERPGDTCTEPITSRRQAQMWKKYCALQKRSSSEWKIFLLSTGCDANICAIYWTFHIKGIDQNEALSKRYSRKQP